MRPENRLHTGFFLEFTTKYRLMHNNTRLVRVKLRYTEDLCQLCASLHIRTTSLCMFNWTASQTYATDTQACVMWIAHKWWLTHPNGKLVRVEMDRSADLCKWYTSLRQVNCTHMTACALEAQACLCVDKTCTRNTQACACESSRNDGLCMRSTSLRVSNYIASKTCANNA